MTGDTKLNNGKADNHSCKSYDDECICETCECNVNGFPKCKTCNKDKGMMLG